MSDVRKRQDVYVIRRKCLRYAFVVTRKQCVKGNGGRIGHVDSCLLARHAQVAQGTLDLLRGRPKPRSTDGHGVERVIRFARS